MNRGGKATVVPAGEEYETNKGKIYKELNKVCYNNVNGPVSTKQEINELLNINKPDIVTLTETKWRSECGIPDVGVVKYDVWMRNRRNKGGGVMVLTTKCVEKVIKSEDKSEILQVTVSSANGKTVNYVGLCVAPKTNAWEREEHEDMLVGMLRALKKIVKDSNDVVIAGDFNCKEVSWEAMTTSGVIDLVDCDTRLSGSDAPSRLDLVFKYMESIENLQCESPWEKVTMC